MNPESEEIDLTNLLGNIISRLEAIEKELNVLRNPDKYVPQIGFMQLNNMQNPKLDEQYNDEKLEEIPYPHGRNTKVQSAGRKS